MTKLTVNGDFHFEGETVRLADGVLYIDGEKAMDFPYDHLQIEADGDLVSVDADRAVSVTSRQQGASGGHATAFAQATSGSGGADPEDIKDRLQETMGKVFKKGFPFS